MNARSEQSCPDSQSAPVTEEPDLDSHFDFNSRERDPFLRTTYRLLPTPHPAFILTGGLSVVPLPQFVFGLYGRRWRPTADEDDKSGSDSDDRGIKCVQCGLDSHTESECPNVICGLCHLKGHIDTECKAPSKSEPGLPTPSELSQAVCMVCGKLGHLSCGSSSAVDPKDIEWPVFEDYQRMKQKEMERNRDFPAAPEVIEDIDLNFAEYMSHAPVRSRTMKTIDQALLERKYGKYEYRRSQAAGVVCCRCGGRHEADKCDHTYTSEEKKFDIMRRRYQEDEQRGAAGAEEKDSVVLEGEQTLLFHN